VVVKAAEYLFIFLRRRLSVGSILLCADMGPYARLLLYFDKVTADWDRPRMTNGTDRKNTKPCACVLCNLVSAVMDLLVIRSKSDSIGLELASGHARSLIKKGFR